MRRRLPENLWNALSKKMLGAFYHSRVSEATFGMSHFFLSLKTSHLPSVNKTASLHHETAAVISTKLKSLKDLISLDIAMMDIVKDVVGVQPHHQSTTRPVCLWIFRCSVRWLIRSVKAICTSADLWVSCLEMLRSVTLSFHFLLQTN